jgi:hypothetical protein
MVFEISGTSSYATIHYAAADIGTAFEQGWSVAPAPVVEASGMMLPPWKNVLPKVDDAERADRARRVTAM